MTLDLLTVGEALVEVMRTEVNQPLDAPGPFTGPYPSGAPFIFAAQAARLGARVGAVGSVGEDAFGRCLRNQLATDGINASGVRVVAGAATGVAFVAYSADGSREFVFNLGAGAMLSPEQLRPAAFEGLRCLHLMGSTLSISEQAAATGLAALELARQNGTLVSFDPNLRPELMPVARARSVFAPFLAAADVLIPTEEELLALTNIPTLSDAVQSLLASKPERVIVVTRGAAGCTVFTAAGQTDVPGFAVTEVDPTGAGDCFDAGFLVRWLAGDPPTEAARWANACGALAVSQRGPMTGAEPLAVVRQFMAAQP